MIEESITWLPKSPTRAVSLDVNVGSDPEVEGSAAQLAQVLMQILANAFQAIPASRDGHVDVKVQPGGPGMVRVEVSDDGVGIPAADIARLFDPVFTTRPVGQGMGLGLPVCHAIVTAHGGTISATSEVGKGSTFTVELPEASAGN